MKKKMVSVGLCMILMLSVLTSCNSASLSDKATAQPSNMMMQGEGAALKQETAEYFTGSDGTFTSSGTMIQTNAQTNRKIIWTVDMEAQTLEFDRFLSDLEQAIQRFGGYLEGSSVSGSSIEYHINREGTMVIRIPSGNLDDFLAQVGTIGTVTYTGKSSEDVTLDYIDVESRITALEVEQERLLTLLESAQDLEAIIQLESRLSEVRYQLENYHFAKNRYDSQIEYSTVNLYVREVQRVSTVHDQSVGQRIAAGWSDTLYRLKSGCENFFVWFVVNLPYLLIWAAFAGIVIWMCLHCVKKRRQKAALPKQDHANGTGTNSAKEEK